MSIKRDMVSLKSSLNCRFFKGGTSCLTLFREYIIMNMTPNMNVQNSDLKERKRAGSKIEERKKQGGLDSCTFGLGRRWGHQRNGLSLV